MSDLPDGVIVVGLDDPAELHDVLHGIFGDGYPHMAKNARREALAAQVAAYDAAREAGRQYFAEKPEEMLAAVCQEGSRRYPERQGEVIGFLQGYIEARTQRDAYRRGE